MRTKVELEQQAELNFSLRQLDHANDHLREAAKDAMNFWGGMGKQEQRNLYSILQVTGEVSEKIALLKRRSQ